MSRMLADEHQQIGKNMDYQKNQLNAVGRELDDCGSNEELVHHSSFNKLKVNRNREIFFLPWLIFLPIHRCNSMNYEQLYK